MKHRFLCVLLPVYSLLDGSVSILVVSLASLVPGIIVERQKMAASAYAKGENPVTYAYPFTVTRN